MNRWKLALLTALLVGLTVPAASAGWRSHGDHEPNTIYDTPGYMFGDSDEDPSPAVRQVYLNAYPSNTVFLDTNANSALLESRVRPTPMQYWEAVFGVWKDCNGDGYIGLAESAVVEYRAELLPNDDICEARPSDPLAHNDGEWVLELLVLGTVDGCEKASEAERHDDSHKCYNADPFRPHPGVIYLEHANLWGDYGHPGEEHNIRTCPIRPHPHGTLSNTGLMLRAADCIFAYRIATTINSVDATGKLGFDDPQNPHHDEDSLLVQNTPVSIFGNPYDNDRTGQLEQDSGNPTFTVWDCSSTTPAGTPGVAPQTAADPTDASLFDAAEQLIDGVVLDVDGTNPTGADCNDGTRTDLGGTYYELNLYGQDPAGVGLIEGANPPTPPGKVTNSFVFTLYDDRGARQTGEPEVDDATDDAAAEASATVKSLFGKRTPDSFGISAVHGTFAPVWVSDLILVTAPQSVNRNTQQPEGRWYTSVYAQLDRAEIGSDFSLPSGSDHIYASEVCPEAFGVVKGWVCDPAAWWPLEGGQPTRPVYQDGRQRGASPGDVYQLRDVDCFDGTLVGGVPVRLSLTPLSAAGNCDPLPQS